jgi:hypothetical protein
LQWRWGPYKATFASSNLIRRHVSLKELVSWLKRGQYVRFLREICPRKNIPSKYNAASGIIAGELLTNVTLIEPFVSVVYPQLVYSIYYLPLLCTSCDVSKICLSPMYNVIESSPDDQIPLKLFVSINSTDTYISSGKFVLKRSISMELRFNTFLLS